MTSRVFYLTHPQVHIDPAVPIQSWGLSSIGRARTESFAKARRLKPTVRIVSSAERKALETARIIAAELSTTVELREAMHENDRTATGFLPPDEFDIVVDQFFARPAVSVRGWERAVDAQDRIVREAEHVLTQDADGDILFVGHGAVGTLLLCHYAGLGIDRAHDQPGGGGNYFGLIKEGRRVIHRWRRMEAWACD
ncbi:MAG: histidine phosphatase family protein [Bradyrhizobiaceae bacterium]|nr:histidine phosphatase family protein [Bradyrhizobiaceae bacterium]